MPEDLKKSKTEKAPKENQDQEPEVYSDVKTLLAWHAPGRPHKNHSKQYFINILLITASIEIIIFLFHIYLLMMVVLSLAFLAIAMALVPPHMFYYKITTEGIRIEDTFFIWEELYDFYLYKHDGVEVIKIRTKAYLPGELTLMLGVDVTPKQIKAILIHFLPFREYVKPTFTQKTGDWLERNFPLEKPTSQSNLPKTPAIK